MDVRAMECFVAVADEGSVSRAASVLQMTQPPLTVRLQNLERELGVPLLVRHGRGVDLTAAGRELAERARRVLTELAAATETVRTIGQGTRGRLTVVAGHSTSPGLLARLAAGGDLGPDVDLRLDCAPDRLAVEQVAQHTAHAGLLHLPPSSPGTVRHRLVRARGLEIAVVAREPLVAILSAAAPASRRDRLDLDDAPALRVELGAQAGGALAEHVRAAAGTATRSVSAGSVVQALAIVEAAGDAYCLLPAEHSRQLPDGLVARRLRQHTGVVETGVCWRPDDDNPVLHRFLRVALSTPEPNVLGPELTRR
ncbi:LysR family transcriptional regulator [Pseudonocardia nematodicida]|uniref:LysR family transcriptional regulator n=1 Tax=Pseudonocardia nematodicida TaxID=1206997 RepID=A0ABV1K5M6_9PSEU